ncbi:terminus macrodomain insulation protein YfbV [Pasteurella sp. PK-2025]|uniref:terminus macrodomain insulation protein YfbV n=1 Tax=unclassified Pasteurella TaxID=2621516 RepID=UPI003C786D8D
MHFFSILKQGQRYLKTWPLESKLGIIFPENRIIKTTCFAQKFMPFVAVFVIVWQQWFAKYDMNALAIAVMTALFALLLPIQGIYWLGKRASTPLPPESCAWFNRICTQLRQVNESVPVVQDKPTYQHLAEVLKKAQRKLDRQFWQEL